MEPVTKFRNDARITWYRCKIDKQVLAGLTRKSDWQGFRQVICQLGLFVATATLACLAWANITVANWYWSVPLLLVALFLHGTFAQFTGLVAIHELVHKTPFKTQFWNEFFLKLYSFISWSDYIWFRPSHGKHHQLTVHKDYDGEVVLPQKFSFKDWQFWLGLLAWNPVSTWKLFKNYAQWATGSIDGDWYRFILPEANTELRRKHRQWARLVLLGHTALAAVFILSGHWFFIIVFTFGTQYCGWLIFLCGSPQHFGLAPDVSDFRLCCRTYTCSWLPAFLYWNMQYHIEHHMFPAVPFYQLPKLRAAICHDLPPAPHGLLATWKHLLSIHRRQIADPSYVYVPELPQCDAGGQQAADQILLTEAVPAG